MSTRAAFLRNVLLLLAALVLVNLLAQRFRTRIDLTGDARYTLAPATLDLLKKLPETVTVTAYFTERMPPDLARTRQDFQDLLVEYAARSNGQVVFEFIDPNSADSIAAKARAEGVRLLISETREKDKRENLKVYMGAVVRMGDRKAVIPAVPQEGALEWVLSSAIQRASITRKPVIGVVQGHHEPPVQMLDQLVGQLNELYDVEPMAIYDTFPINARFNTLLLIDPKDTIPPLQLQRLLEFMGRGNGLVLAYGAVDVDLSSSPVADLRRTDLEPWLRQLGVRIEPRIVTDAKCGQVQVMQSGLPFPVPVAFPYFPLIDHFGDHPVASGLDLAMFQFAAPLAFVGDTSIRYAPLLMSSGKSALLAPPAVVDIRKAWSDADFPDGPQVLGAALEGTFAPPQRSRAVVFTNGTFCNSFANGQPVQLPQGNVDLMVNAVDWVSHNTGLLELRGKEVSYRPIADVGDARRALLKWMNLLLPVALVIGYGLLRAQWRRRQRMRRMRPGHVR